MTQRHADRRSTSTPRALPTLTATLAVCLIVWTLLGSLEIAPAWSAPSGVSSCDDTSDEEPSDTLPASEALARLRVAIQYLEAQLLNEDAVYRLRLTQALAQIGLTDAEQATVLGGANWVTVAGRSPAPAGELTFFANKFEEDFYSQNLAPLYKSLMTLNKSGAPSEVPIAGLVDLDNRMSALRSFEQTVATLRDQAIALEAERGAYVIGVLGRAQALAFLSYSFGTFGTFGEIVGNQLWTPSDADRSFLDETTARLSAFKTEADALQQKLRSLKTQFTVELGGAGDEPSCDAGASVFEPPSDLVLD